MTAKRNQPIKKSELGNNIKKSLSAYIKSNSNIFATKELRMIAYIKNNQSHNNVSKPENIIMKGHKTYHYASNPQKKTINRTNIIVSFGGFINKIFQQNRVYKIVSDFRLQNPIIQFKTIDKRYNRHLKSKGVWLKWCA